MLAFIAAEVHKPFLRLLFPTSETEARLAADLLRIRLGFLAANLREDHILRRDFSTADAFLYVMVRWAREAPRVALPDPLAAYADRIEACPAVRAALAREGLAPARILAEEML